MRGQAEAYEKCLGDIASYTDGGVLFLLFVLSVICNVNNALE